MAQKKRKSASRKSSAKRKNSNTITQKRRAQLNQRWALVAFAAALLTFLSLFRADGAMLGPLGDILSGSIGVGFLILPFALVICGIVLMISRGRPIKWRMLCLLLIPYCVGLVSHSLAGPESLVWDTIVESGKQLSGGGVLAGYPAALLINGISRIGTVILAFIALIFVTLTAFDITVIAAFDAIKSFFGGLRHEVEYEEYEEEDVVEKRPEIKLPRRKRPIIDVPLDGENAPQVPEEPKKPKKAFELPESNVPTPADIIEIPVESTAPAIEVTAEPKVETHINSDNFTEDVLKAIDEKEKKETGDAFTVPEEEGETRPMYSYPPVSLLNPPKAGKGAAVNELKATGIKLGETLRNFGIDAHVVNIISGPTVTCFEVKLDAGVKLSKLTTLSDDIALALGATGVHIAPIPDKSLIGIEVPNKSVQVVNISEVVSSDGFENSKSNVAFALGKDISGECITSDMEKLIHLLIAGTTGSGKSVCINSIIVSLLFRASPSEVRLIMIDPKMVELGVYNGIPHLLVPVVTDAKKAAGALQWAVLEMMNRYKMFAALGVRDMKGYNKAVAKSGEADPMPHIIIVIDELSDLMVVARKGVEDSIMRLSQMARAAGMHLIIATQRPSADVITGVIKSNIPSRIAFAVASKIESNIILGSAGAEKLVGRGDMLYHPQGAAKPARVQGCFISDDEVEEVVRYIKENSTVEYSEDILNEIEKQAEKVDSGTNAVMGGGEDDGDADELLYAAIDIVVESGSASTSMLQRRLKLGYSRAARIIDQMEERGIVGEFEGSKPRRILLSREEWQEMKMRREEM